MQRERQHCKHTMIAIGTKLGVYELISPLGTGGMGEVYRARDSKLGRDVAIKILPRLFTSDPERLARFEREARLLAALNHPHIGAIYGFEEADGVSALILELIEGPTLAERLARPEGLRPRRGSSASGAGAARALNEAGQALPIHQALDCARQIAEAQSSSTRRRRSGWVTAGLLPAHEAARVSPGSRRV